MSSLVPRGYSLKLLLAESTKMSASAGTVKFLTGGRVGMPAVDAQVARL